MKLKRLLEIKTENDRFISKLNDAILKAKTETTRQLKDGRDWRDGDDAYETVKTNECGNTKESAAFKRSAMDLKRILSNL